MNSLSVIVPFLLSAVIVSTHAQSEVCSQIGGGGGTCRSSLCNSDEYEAPRSSQYCTNGKCCLKTNSAPCNAVGGICVADSSCPNGRTGVNGGARGRCTGNNLKCCVPTNDAQCSVIGGVCRGMDICKTEVSEQLGLHEPATGDLQCSGDWRVCCQDTNNKKCHEMGGVCRKNACHGSNEVKATWGGSGKCRGSDMVCCVHNAVKGCSQQGGRCRHTGSCPYDEVSGSGSGLCAGAGMKCCKTN